MNCQKLHSTRGICPINRKQNSVACQKFGQALSSDVSTLDIKFVYGKIPKAENFAKLFSQIK